MSNMEIEKGFTRERLQELASFREVNAVTQELGAIDGRVINPDDPESLEQRIKDIARRKELDLSAAHQAFRAELVEAGDDFLPLISRLSLLAGFDPMRIKAQNDAHAQDVAELERVRRHEPYLYNQIRGLISIGSRPFASEAHPLGEASGIERVLLRLQQNVIDHISDEIGMDAGREFFTGTVPSVDVLVLDEPKVVRTDEGVDIEYKLPMRLHGIVDVKNDVPGEKEIDPSRFGEEFTVVDGKVIANPHLEELANALRTRPEYGKLSMSPYFGVRAIMMASSNSWYDHNKQQESQGSRLSVRSRLR
jgi:hypothetical protein